MNLSNPELWARLEAFSLDQADASLTFSDRLARENNWERRHARCVVGEYKRFLYLAQVTSHPVSPSKDVDQAWHLHLVYTKSYWEQLCRDTLKSPFHHEPSAGGQAERAKFRDWYRKTLESYAHEFGESAPAGIWPASESRSARHAARWGWVDQGRHWILPKRIAAWAVMVAVIGVGAMVAAPAPASSSASTFGAANFHAASFLPVLDWSGPEFLVFYIGLVVVMLFLSFWMVSSARAAASRRMIVPNYPEPYEIAWLNGGKGRVALAVVSTLMERGLVTAKEGELSLSGQPSTHPLSPVEQVGYDIVANAGAISSPGFSNALEGALLPMRQKMEDNGLLMSPPQLKKARWAAAWPLLLVMAIGVMKVFTGISRDRPVGFLVGLLLFTLIILIVRVTNVSRATALGLKLLKSLRETHRDTKKKKFTMAGYSHAESTQVMPMAVALFGLAVLDHTAYGSVHKMYAGPNGGDGSGGGGSDGSSSDSGGSDGGGSSCGGGGCGGCGGGGGD